MALYSPKVATLSGVAPTVITCAAGGDGIKNSRGTLKTRFINGSGGSITVTAAAVITARPGDGTFPPATLGNQQIVVGAGAAVVAGPWPAAFNDANGYVQFTYSGVTSLTAEAWDEQ